VTAVDRGRYVIRDAEDELSAEPTGRLLHAGETSADLPCIGDWVCVSRHDHGNHASIHGVLPRASFLRRKSAGRNIGFQMLAANIDIAFIVQSCHFDFNVRRLERYLVMVREGGIEPIILLTKTDLIGADELEQRMRLTTALPISPRIPGNAAFPIARTPANRAALSTEPSPKEHWKRRISRTI
jgi:ribosome biogenesis GTPase